MINSLLSFGAKSVNPEILEQTLTIREDIVNEIEKTCVQKVLEKSTCQSLVIAPRGSGKTHIVKVLYHRLINNPKISDKSVIAYMTEDEVGIDNFTDLMISMLRSFIRYKEPGSNNIENKIEDASHIKDANEREIFVKNILNDFAQKRIIILLIENFDKILNSLGDKGQRNLRSYIHQYNKLSIIATSQNLIANLQNSKNAFYNFFNVQQLKKLDFNQSVEFLKSIAKSENNTNLLKELEEQSLEGKLRAIYELTEGNHRLLVTFYTFLKAELKTELSVIFIKVMNDLKPYYEQFINILPAQQQKIVKFISMKRGAISGKEIARACFIEPNVFSKQISLLYEKGMIDKNKSGKDVFYELKEPLMRICFEINESSNGIAKLFVDFLSCFYDRQDIRNKYLVFKYGAKFQKEDIRQKFENEADLYGIVLDYVDKDIVNFAHSICDKISNFNEIDNAIKEVEDAYKYFDKGNSFYTKKEYKEALESHMKSLDILPNNERVTMAIGLCHIDLGKYKEAEKYFRRANGINPDNEITLTAIGNLLMRQNRFDKAIEEFNRALIKNPHSGILLGGLGMSYMGNKQYQLAIKFLNKSIKKGIKESWAYNSLAISYYELKKYKEASENYKKAIEIKPTENAYHKLSTSLIEIEQFEEAIKYLHEAIKLNPKNGKYFSNLGLVYVILKKYEDAIKNFKVAVEFLPGSELDIYGLGLSYLMLDKYNKAILNFQKVIEVNPENTGAYKGLVFSYNSLNKHLDSNKILKNLFQIDAKDPDVYNLLGLNHLMINKIEKARDYFNKGLKIDPENKNIKFSLLGLSIRINDSNESISQLKKLITQVDDNELEIESLKNDILYNLFKYGSDKFIKSYFEIVLKLFIKEEKESQFWKTLPDALFEILINIEDYNKERLSLIQKVLAKSLAEYEQSVIPMKMFGVGIDYLKNKEKNAIFKLSKEERKLFTEAVVNKRNLDG